MQGENAYLEKFAGIDDIHRRLFAAMLSHLDDSVGKVLSAVKDTGTLESTLIVFLSDNGGPTRELTSRNTPLRGEKGQLYEGGIRVPFLMQLPGNIEAGQVYDEAVISLDLFPTTLALAGVGKADSLDGVDLLPYLNGENSGAPHDNLFWRVGNAAALRSGDWKIVRSPVKGAAGPWELYDLDSDYQEQNNLAGSETGRLRELAETWDRLNADMIPPVFR